MAMREHMSESESLDPYESPEADYDWDYDEEPARRDTPKVLWGRVAILGAGIILAFLIGRMTAGDGIPASDLARAERQAEDARAEVASLRDRVSSLEAQLADAQADADADTTTGTDTTDDDADTTDEGGDTTAPEGDVETHVVASGETLTTISEEYYGNTAYADYIAEYNGIADPSLVSVGTELQIPPEPEG
jgi:nucleoid-associated protein YgaU